MTFSCNLVTKLLVGEMKFYVETYWITRCSFWTAWEGTVSTVVRIQRTWTVGKYD